MCTVLLPLGVNPITVNKYILSLYIYINLVIIFGQEKIFSMFLSFGSDVDKASVQGYDAADTITVSQNIGKEHHSDAAQFFLHISTHVRRHHYVFEASVNSDASHIPEQRRPQMNLMFDSALLLQII